MFNKEEMADILLRLSASHSDLRTAIEDKDREEALRATKMSALLGMRLVGIIPNMDQLGVKQISADEMSQLKKALNSLLS